MGEWLKKLQECKSFIVRHRVLFVLLFVLFLQMLPNAGFLPWGGLWLRMQTKGMFNAEFVALQDITNEVWADFARKIGEKFPKKSVQERKQLAHAELVGRWNELLPKLQERAVQRAYDYRDFTAYDSDGKKYSYMYSIDSFYFLRFARNLLEKGIYGDLEKDGLQYDTFVTAPLGDYFDVFWLQPFIIVGFFKLFRLIDPSVPLMESASWLPVVLVFVCLVLVFWLAYQLFGLTAAFFSSLLFGLLGVGVYYTAWGFADTDAFTLLFSLLPLVFLSLAFLANDVKKQFLWLAGIGFSFGLFSRVWPGWWFLFDVFLLVLGVNFVYEFVARRGKVVRALWLFVLFFVFSGMGVTLLFDFEEFRLGVISSAVSYRENIAGIHRDVWPHVYETVSELQKKSFWVVVNANGGWLMFFIAVGAYFFVVVRERGSARSLVCAVFVIWLFGMIYGSSKAIRFALLLVTPLSFGFGVGMSLLVRRAAGSGWFPRFFVALVFLGGFVVIVNSQQVAGAYAAVVKEKPFLNDAWFDVLSFIKQSSRPDAIVTSWWDFGHIIKYVADRPVTVDGSSQHRMITYWVGRMFLTPDENEAVGILQMLDCGSTRAFEVLENRMNDTFKAFDLLNQVIVSDLEDAKKLLGMHADEILPLIKCRPPEGFVVVSGDMVAKANVWSHIGGWDPKKARAVQIVREMSRDVAMDLLEKELGWNESVAFEEYENVVSLVDFNEYVGPRFSFDASTGSCLNTTDVVACGNGVFVNLTSFDAKLIGGALYSVVYVDNGSLVEKVLNDSAGGSVLLIQNKDGFETMLVSKELARSVFSRLYFYEGKGLDNFKMLIWKNVPHEGPVLAYKVLWNQSTIR